MPKEFFHIDMELLPSGGAFYDDKKDVLIVDYMDRLNSGTQMDKDRVDALMESFNMCSNEILPVQPMEYKPLSTLFYLDCVFESKEKETEFTGIHFRKITPMKINF